eukprot:845662-Pleurochrysis_carterae.AAC.1
MHKGVRRNWKFFHERKSCGAVGGGRSGGGAGNDNLDHEGVTGKGEERSGLIGRYETAYGITEPVEIQKGLGQGDLLDPVRSKLIFAIIQQAMQRLVPGIEFNTKGSVCDTVRSDTLQLAMEVMWVMTKLLGLNMQIKGKKKTAWSRKRRGQEFTTTKKDMKVTLQGGR